MGTKCWGARQLGGVQQIGHSIYISGYDEDIDMVPYPDCHNIKDTMFNGTVLDSTQFFDADVNQGSNETSEHANQKHHQPACKLLP